MFSHFTFESYGFLSFLWHLSIHVCQAVVCDGPPAVVNADTNTQLKPPFLNGTTIFYSCHDGYALNQSNNSFAICVVENETQHWRLEPFSCAPSCNDLPIVKNGHLNLENRKPPFFSGDIVLYECNFGYITERGRVQEEIECGVVNGNVSWILPLEACRPKSCGYPGDIENSVRTGNLYTFPNSVTYYCKEGFQLKGSERIYCTATGNWRPNIPSCDAVVCPLLANPKNGSVSFANRQYNAVALYTCENPLRLKGDAQRTCQSDATWSGNPPTCVEITCLDPDPFPNGRAFPERKIHHLGQLIIFSCMDNSHRQAATCTEDGNWSVRPPICEAVSTTTLSKEDITPFGTDDESTSKGCEDPGFIKNGKKNFTGTAPNINLTYTCEYGYELRGQGTLICSPNGKWNIEKLPICVKPISVLTTIIGVIIGVILIILLGAGIYLYSRWRGTKLQGFGKKSKALTTDATDLEEIARLEKGKRPIPVTVL